MKILVVDDEKDVELLFRMKFRDEIQKGLLEMDFAYSGQDALKKIRNSEDKRVKYIISDINMPGMSGFELLESVKEEFPQIKVSMVSAYSDKENQNRAKESGARAFFTKPVDFESMKEEVYQVIEQLDEQD